jgi:hypothetical protein
MKKCNICEEPSAEFKIKNSTDYYCEDCAEEQFADISYLVKVTEQAQQLKQLIDDQEE